MRLAAAWARSLGAAVGLAAAGLTLHEFGAGPARLQATLSVCTPLLASAVGLALVGVFRGVLAGAADGLTAIYGGAEASTPALTQLLRRGQPPTPQQLLLTALPPAAPGRPWGLT